MACLIESIVQQYKDQTDYEVFKIDAEVKEQEWIQTTFAGKIVDESKVRLHYYPERYQPNLKAFDFSIREIIGKE